MECKCCGAGQLTREAEFESGFCNVCIYFKCEPSE